MHHHARRRRARAIGLLARLDTNIEVQYFLHGGIMNYVLRRRLANASEGALQQRLIPGPVSCDDCVVAAATTAIILS